ncbi:hypothetical protein L7F22_004032 [Adiantum nelumboides]|nr:hypothetical protein [Adiantum nelumboides]
MIAFSYLLVLIFASSAALAQPPGADSVITASIIHSGSLWSLPPDRTTEEETESELDSAAAAFVRRRWLQESPVTSAINLARFSAYYMELTVGGGSPDSRRKLFLLLDTANSLTWLQCHPCPSCHPQLENVPLFDPAASSTLNSISYDHPLCLGLAARTSSLHGPPGSPCTYHIRYVKGQTSGSVVTDTITLPSGHRFTAMPLGCSFYSEVDFVGAAGNLALDAGSYSFPSQLKLRGYSSRFSFCLPPRFSNVQSTIVFGGPIVPHTTFTPLFADPEGSGRYHVKLVGISVGGTVLSVPHFLFDIDPNTGYGGMIIDTGTTISTLPQLAYRAFRDSLTRGIPTRFRIAHYSTPLYDTCYVLQSHGDLPDFYTFIPSVTYHFAEGVDLHLPPDLLFAPRHATSNRVCLMLAPDVSPRSYLGNVQQQHTRFTFDQDNNRVGFAPNAC